MKRLLLISLMAIGQFAGAQDTDADTKRKTVENLVKELLNIVTKDAPLYALYDGAKELFLEARDEAEEGNPFLGKKLSEMIREVTQEDVAVSDIDKYLDDAYKNNNKAFFESLMTKVINYNNAVLPANDMEKHLVGVCKDNTPECIYTKSALAVLIAKNNNTVDEIKYINYLQGLINQE